MTYTHKWYHSPIDLPVQGVGNMQIRHRIIPKGEEIPIVGLRQAITRGIRPIVGTTEKPLVIHELVEGRGSDVSLWMTDLPEELNQIAEMLYNVDPSGRVLVGGLGLGILARTVAQRDGVTDVVVVERSTDVIKLCAPPNSDGADGLATFKAVQSDIYKYLRTTKEKFDYYLLDTWTGTSESTWWTEVLPLRRVIRKRWGISPEIHGWAEDIMWGQIYRSLTGKPPHWHYTYLPVPMSHDEAVAFLNMAGSSWWEKQYGKGIDRYVKETSRRRSA